MKLKPVNDKIVVKPNEKNEEEVTDSGIILPLWVVYYNLCALLKIFSYLILYN